LWDFGLIGSPGDLAVGIGFLPGLYTSVAPESRFDPARLTFEARRTATSVWGDRDPDQAPIHSPDRGFPPEARLEMSR